MSEPSPAGGVGRGLAISMAFITGSIAANLYYAQPLLPTIARDLGEPVDEVASILVAAQVGFGAGLALILPLSDLLGRRSLLVGLLGIAAVALLGCALAPNLTLLIIGSVLAGASTVATQLVVTSAAAMATDQDRGRVLGTVISGLLGGLLLARVVAGLVADLVGWRVVFAGAAVLMVIALAAGRLILPPDSVTGGQRYRAVLASVALILARHRDLRTRTMLGGLGFAAFSLFWSTSALQLDAAPFRFDTAQIGLFGLLGLAGALAANIAGRVRHHRRPAPTAAAIGVVAAAFALMWISPSSFPVLVVGAFLLDAGVQALHVLNQRTVQGFGDDLRTRANTAYMVVYFSGGALGTTAGAIAWSLGGWGAVCAVGLAIAALAALVVGATGRG